MNVYDEQTWDTMEVERWIDNTEPLYRASVICRSADDYREAFENLLSDQVDMDEVNWEYIAEQGAIKNGETG